MYLKLLATFQNQISSLHPAAYIYTTEDKAIYHKMHLIQVQINCLDTVAIVGARFDYMQVN